MPGLGLTTEYTWFTFYRESAIDELHPGIVWIWVTDEVERDIWKLIGWYEELGRYEEAATTCRMLTEAPEAKEEADRRANRLLSRTGPRW